MNKRGSTLLSDSLPEIILAASAVVILIFLFISLFGNYNKTDEITQSLKKYVTTRLDDAKKYKTSNLLIFNENCPTRYFLVYFNSMYDDTKYPSVTNQYKYRFTLNSAFSKLLCICSIEEDVDKTYSEQDVVCQRNNCIKLDSNITIDKSKIEGISIINNVNINNAIALNTGLDADIKYENERYSLIINFPGNRNDCRTESEEDLEMIGGALGKAPIGMS